MESAVNSELALRSKRQIINWLENHEESVEELVVISVRREGNEELHDSFSNLSASDPRRMELLAIQMLALDKMAHAA